MFMSDKFEGSVIWGIRVRALRVMPFADAIARLDYGRSGRRRLSGTSTPSSRKPVGVSVS